MSDYFDDVIELLHEKYDSLAADNTRTKFTWSLKVTREQISLDNPLVEKAIGLKKFREYFDKWYLNWHDKSVDGKVECFEAAFISFVGYLCKRVLGKLSDGEIEVKDFTSDDDDADNRFDYIKCDLHSEGKQFLYLNIYLR